MPTIHFLNVNEGDCNIIQHISGHVTVIDVCNASIPKMHNENEQSMIDMHRSIARMQEVLGNFNQKDWPDNPVEYMQQHSINRIFRYIQTHPDMDHMDGIESLFTRYAPVNFWDTNNTRTITSWDKGPYRESDWTFYTSLRDGKLTNAPKRLTLLSGATGQYYNVNADDEAGGDGLQILAPTKELLEDANKANGNYNDSSYVLLYKTGDRKAVFAGDSHDKTWEHVLSKHSDSVRDVDLLIAPHHGRDSDRDYKFLEHLNPSLTLIGNAPSKHINYNQWNRRGLCHITNNQAGSIIVDIIDESWVVYATNKTYAEKTNTGTTYHERLKAWKLGEIPRKA